MKHLKKHFKILYYLLKCSHVLICILRVFEHWVCKMLNVERHIQELTRNHGHFKAITCLPFFGFQKQLNSRSVERTKICKKYHSHCIRMKMKYTCTRLLIFPHNPVE